MRNLAIVLLLAIASACAFPREHHGTRVVTVEQFRRIVSASKAMRDSKLASVIANCRLTERLDAATFTEIENQLPGKGARSSLLAVADESAALDLPPSEIPSLAPPSLAAQSALLARTEEYVATAIPKQPDLVATQQSTNFVGSQDQVPFQVFGNIVDSLWRGYLFASLSWPGPTEIEPYVPHNRLAHSWSDANVRILYRGGEILYSSDRNGLVFVRSDDSLGMAGIPGAILSPLPDLIASHKVTWSHWERDGGRLLAVFHYDQWYEPPGRKRLTIPENEAGPRLNHYDRDDIAVDPADGTILRFSEIAGDSYRVNGHFTSLNESRTVVEYARVRLGETIYVCPVRRILVAMGTIADVAGESELARPEVLADIAYSQYHLYGTGPHELAAEAEPLDSPTATVREPDLAPVARRVTVAQLEQLLAGFHHRHDRKAAQKIDGVELTERLSAAKFDSAEARLPGPASRGALLALYDASAFKSLPSEDIPSDPPPDASHVHSMWQKALKDIQQIASASPPVSATRATTYFDAHPDDYARNAARINHHLAWRETGTETATVLERAGHMSVDPATLNSKPVEKADAEEMVNTSEDYGTVVEEFLADLSHATVTWGRWERGAAGLVAVFRYQVPKSESHYTVGIPGGQAETTSLYGYHGEVAIDLENSSVLRITMKADRTSADAVAQADLMIEYGPVNIAGRTYTCPVRGVGLIGALEFKFIGVKANKLVYARPLHAALKDVAFSDYRVLQAEPRR